MAGEELIIHETCLFSIGDINDLHGYYGDAFTDASGISLCAYNFTGEPRIFTQKWEYGTPWMSYGTAGWSI